MKIKNHFLNSYGLTGYSIIYSVIIFIILLFISLNKYTEWQCKNYQEVTGRESIYISFDACYVKNKDGELIRYDSYYKE